MLNRKSVTTIILASTAAMMSTGAVAGTRWQNHHPRRVEVNHRLANQNRRIDHERREGEITGAQAHALHQDDHAIRSQERADATTDGGHITKGEQHHLNQELNANSGAIGHYDTLKMTKLPHSSPHAVWRLF